MALSTIGDLGPESDRGLLKRRVLYSVTTITLTVILALGVMDVLGWVDAYGVTSARVAATGGGYTLEVQYPAVTRPAMASPFEISVERPGGFDGPITLAVTREYLKIWDENGLFPAPSSETVRGEWVEWEFDPPDVDVLTVYYDARIEPAVQSGQGGAVAVVDDGEQIVAVEFYTEVRP